MAETIIKDAPVEDLTLGANKVVWSAQHTVTSECARPKDTLQFTQGDLKSDCLISTINNNKSAILIL